MYNNISAYISGSITGSFAPAKYAYFKSNTMSSSATQLLSISTSTDFGKFIPTKVTFHYDSVQATTATSKIRFNFGYTAPYYNNFITSGTLSLDGASGARSNQVEHFGAFNATSSMPEDGSLFINITNIGTNHRLTGSFIVQGLFLEF